MPSAGLAQFLQEFGLESLAEGSTVVGVRHARFITGEAVLIGCPSVDAIIAIEAVHPQARLGLIVPLPRGPDPGARRAAASGWFSESARAALETAGVVSLGDALPLAAKFHALEQAMWATNTMIAREAFTLALKNGVNLNLLYGALANGAAGSHAFRGLWPNLMSGAVEEANRTLWAARQALSTGLALAARETFYAPLLGLAKQSSVEPLSGESVAGMDSGPPPAVAEIEPAEPIKVGFVGLGAMGRPMSLVLHNAGLNVAGFDVWEGARTAYTAAGGRAAQSALDCAHQADVFLLIVVNAAQVEDILFAQGALMALAPDAVILIMSTVPASEALRIAARIKEIRTDVALVDCPVSGATPRAATGDLMVFCGGLEDAGPGKGKAYRVLRLLSSSQGHPEYLVRVPGGVGRGSGVKLSNQHLAGTQISNVAETQAFGKKLGLPGRKTNALLMTGPGYCWVLGHRGVSMLDGLTQPPTSAIDIFVKDMGIVATEADALDVPIPLAGLVQQQFMFAKSLGWGKDDDSGLARVWKFAGVDITCAPE